MKKIKKLLIASLFLSGGLLVPLTSCSTKPDNPEPVIEKTEYAITIYYPDEATTTLKFEEGTTISLNEYIREIEGKKFVGFFLESEYINQITTYTFDKNGRIYVKYEDITDVDNPIIPPTPEPEKHVCEFEETLSFDANNHYYKCKDENCELKSGVEAHTFIQEVKEEYLFKEATNNSPALYYSRCSVCGAKGAVFEFGERLKETYTLTINSNLEDISYVFNFKDDEIVEASSILLQISEMSEQYINYAPVGLYLDDTCSVLFEDKVLTADTTIYVQYENMQKTVTIKSVGLPQEIEYSEEREKGSSILLQSLGFVTPKDYVIKGWYKDIECTIPLENETIVEQDITLYAKCDLYLNYQNIVYTSDVPSWYQFNQYTEMDKFTWNLNVTFNKAITGTLSAVLYDTNNNTYDFEIELSENKRCAQLTKTFTVNDLKDNPITFAKYVISDDIETFTVIDGENGFTLEDKTLVTPKLNDLSVYNDYSSYVVNLEDNPSMWKETLKTNYRDDIDFDTSWKRNKEYDNIDMDNLDVLKIDLELESDIHITTREQYLKSIFAHENFAGNLNLNGHTIYLTFDGCAGDALFKNNYGTIYNGTIYINGLRDASTENKEFNVIKNSSAVVENNYGYIHNISFMIPNFGYNFETKHNVNAVIGTNRSFALVEDCTFVLSMSYIGTKLDRIKNPIATSFAGIFREVKTGTIYDYSMSSSSSQELKNLTVQITSFEASDELKSETGLVELVCDTTNPLEFVRFDKETGDISTLPCNDKFYGGSYYFDGTNYHKFNGGMLNGKEMYYNEPGSLTYYNSQLSEFESTSVDLIMFGYGEYKEYYDKTYYFDSRYRETSYCSYGYLLPEFSFVAYNNTMRYQNSSNLKWSFWLKEDNPYISEYEDKYIVGNEDGYVEILYTESRYSIALTNSLLKVNEDVCGMVIDISDIYYTWFVYNDVENTNVDYDKPAYVDGYEWHKVNNS